MQGHCRALPGVSRANFTALLAAARIAPPYVLVGHSFGGLTARLFASRHPAEVAGLVLLDPAMPADWRSPSAPRRARVARGVALCRYGERAARLRVTDLVVALVRLGALDAARAVGRLVSSGNFSRADEGILVPAGKLAPDVLDIAVRSWTHRKFFEALGSQIASIGASAAEIADAQDFGSMPLVVVSGELSSEESQLAGHADLAARSRHGRHIVATESGHWIPLESSRRRPCGDKGRCGCTMMRWPVTSDIMRTLVIALLLLVGCSSTPPPAPYDVLITGGSVIDGDGTPPVIADIGIRDGHLAAIGNLSSAEAVRRIDASGLTVSPGFIDIHNHSDYTILLDPKAESMIRQGVTTMVLGESRSAGPEKPGAARDDGVKVDWTTLGGYFSRLERQRIATNIASYVGEEQVWTYVKGYDQSPATAAELEAMKALVAAAMEEGAMGLSTALLMPPSSLATTANLTELAKVAGRYGGIYSTHIRDEGEGVFQAIGEAIQVGAGAKIPVDIIHMKIAHKKLWGRAAEIAAMVQKARDAGLDIRANVYPYTAGQNNLSSIIPPWAHDGGRQKLLERLRDPGARRRMRTEILNGIPGGTATTWRPATAGAACSWCRCGTRATRRSRASGWRS